MKLVLFDVDGTLTRTVDIDASCFVQAFADEFNISAINTNWTEYTHYTDSGITDQIFREKMGHPPSRHEEAQLINRFLSLLEKAWSKSPEMFAEVPGAGETIEHLQSESHWVVAIATGCWLESAHFKLNKAGVKIEDIPIASADDSTIREKIVKLAIKRAEDFYKTKDFERTVYIGDGVWDIKMSRQLNLPFIGVGDGETIKVLSDLGARHFLPDFSNYDELRKKLNEASIP